MNLNNTTATKPILEPIVKDNKDIVLVVWSSSSEIWKSIFNSLTDTFDVIWTTREKILNCIEEKQTEKNHRMYLDISKSENVDQFIEDFLSQYWNKKIKTLFLNVWMTNAGDTIDRWNFFRRANNWDPTITTHINNLMLVESLQRKKLINENTKVIYNASIQVFLPKDGFNDYAFLKNMVSSLLLGDERLDCTILCCSLVKGTTGSDKFEKVLKEKGSSIENYVKNNMPNWQPSLEDVNIVTKLITSHKEQTKNKYVLIDGWAFKQNYANNPKVFDEDILYNLLFFNQKTREIEDFFGNLVF